MFDTKKFTRPALGTLTVGALALTACGDGDGDTTTLRAGTIYGPNVPVVECGFQELADDPGLEEVGLELETVDSAQLGAEGELLEQASTGELDIALGIGSMLATVFDIPELEMFEAYFLYDSVDDVERVQATDAAQDAWATLEEEANLVYVGTPWLYGERHMVTQEPVYGPEDLAGIDFRVPNTNISRASAEALGTSVATTEYDETYLALQQGVIEAAENPLNIIADESFDEQVNYVNLTTHLITTHGFLVNGDRWDSLTEEQQEFLDEAVSDLADNVAQCLEERDQEALDEWEEAGEPEIVPEDEIDREALAEMVQEAYAEGQEWGDEYAAMLEELGEQ